MQLAYALASLRVARLAEISRTLSPTNSSPAPPRPTAMKRSHRRNSLLHNVGMSGDRQTAKLTVRRSLDGRVSRHPQEPPTRAHEGGEQVPPRTTDCA